MAMPKTEKHEMLQVVEKAAVHVGATVLGALLMFVGVAMGVTLVLVPVGVGVGFLGLLVFMWGLFGDK